MKEINIGQATALTSPDPLVLVCTKERGWQAEYGTRIFLHVCASF